MSIVVRNQARLHRWVVWLIVKLTMRKLCVKKYEISGSYRRGKQFCNDIDVVIPVHTHEQVEGLVQLMLRAGWGIRPDRNMNPNIMSHQFVKETRLGTVVLDLFPAFPGTWGNTMLFTTGSKRFNDIIRANIVETGYQWTKPQFFTETITGKNISFDDEAAVFRFLGSAPVRPKDRDLEDVR